MLTDKSVKNARTGMHADGGGLYLRVRATGKKVWVKRDRAMGGDRWITLGDYPAITLADARKLAAGVIPDVTADDAVRQYMGKLAVRRPEHVEHILTPLNVKKTLVSYTRRELVHTLQEKATHAPVMANRMLTRWQDFFNFCVQQGWLESNPLSGVQRKFVGGKEKHRNRVLDWDEIVEFLRLVLDPHTKLALYFILATGLRPSEALWVMRHRKLDAIPTKTVAHKVPAVPHVKAILRLVKRVPVSHLTLSNALRRKGVGYTPHDLRRTFATRLSDLGVMPHVVEKCLNHKMTGVMQVYNHAEYWPERVAAMKLWGHKLRHLRHLARAATDG